MKVTFLIPPALDSAQAVDRTSGCNYSIYFLPLLPFLYSASLLKDEVESIAMLDFPAKKKSLNDFKNFIREDKSDVYILYTVFLCQNTDFIARNMIRNANPQAHFIFSGPQPTFSPEAFLDKEDTVVARGEPEFIIRDVVRAIKDGSGLRTIAGLSYYDGSKAVHNTLKEFIMDLDALPIPDRTLLDHSPYYNPKLHRMPHTAVLTSRGCFGRCWYCVPNSLDYARELEHKKHYGKKPPPRLHSAQRAIEEFVNIAKLGFKSVSIMDDEFLWNERRTIEICRGIKDFNLEWSCLARPDMFTEEITRAMAEAGCSYVDLGTESFDENVLKAIRKDMLPEDTRRTVRLLKKYGIDPELNVLLGAAPEETEETIKKTLKEVKRLDVDYVLFSIANPFPGTDFYDAAKKEGWMCYGDYVPVDPSKSAIISYPHLKKDKLEKLIANAYMSFYFSPQYLLKQIFKLKGIKDFRNKLKTAISLIKRNF